MTPCRKQSRRADLLRPSERRPGSAALPPGLLDDIDGYALTCLECEGAPRVSELARVLGIPLGRFVETFHRATGLIPSTYLKKRQIEAAKLLLLRTDMPVDKIAYAAGFGTRRTFFRQFRQRAGLSPAQYRERMRNVSSRQVSRSIASACTPKGRLANSSQAPDRDAPAKGGARRWPR